MKVSSIRFNLKFFNANGGEDVVRTLDDLAAKFNLCDLWEYFRTGDLAQWLKSINELQLAETIKSLTGITDKQTALNKLCEALGLAVASDEILELCEIIDRQDLAKESHKKIEHLYDQTEARGVAKNLAALLPSIGNEQYINAFCAVMKELDLLAHFLYYYDCEFPGNTPPNPKDNLLGSRKNFINEAIKRMQAFEPGFLQFLDHWGENFLLDLMLKYSAHIESSGGNYKATNDITGRTYSVIRYTRGCGFNCVDGMSEADVEGILIKDIFIKDFFLLSLMLGNKKWSRVASYIYFSCREIKVLVTRFLLARVNTTFLSSRHPVRRLAIYDEFGVGALGLTF